MGSSARLVAVPSRYMGVSVGFISLRWSVGYSSSATFFYWVQIGEITAMRDGETFARATYGPAFNMCSNYCRDIHERFPRLESAVLAA